MQLRLILPATFTLTATLGCATVRPEPNEVAQRPATTFDCAAFATPDQKRDEDTIRRIERSWLAAEVRGNVEFLECLVKPGYVNIARDGKRRSKAELLAGVAKNRGKTTAVPPIETAVVVDGDSATAFSSSKSLDKNGQMQEARYVDSFVFQDGLWHAYCGVDL